MIVFLDRDGTINELGEGYITNPEKLELIPNAGKAIRILNDINCKTIVVTNQSIVGRGKANHLIVRKLHNKIDDLLAEFDATIDHYLYCFHHPDEQCWCRKPATDMFWQAKILYPKLLPKHCWMIGDNKTDIEFGQNCGINTILVRTGYGSEHENLCNPDYVCDDLYSAAKFLKDLKHGFIRRNN